jgi:flagellin-like protein
MGRPVRHVTDCTPAVSTRSTPGSDRAASPVVGVVVLVGVTVLLASTVVAAVGLDRARPGPAPQVSLDAKLSATDGWPDGQRLRLVHEGGDALTVADLAVVVAFERTGDRARLSGFPTGRLTDEHRRGADLFDRTYAGVDGALDATQTDGRWTAGETASLRIAQGELDVRPGDRATVTVVHEEADAVLAERVVTAGP